MLKYKVFAATTESIRGPVTVMDQSQTSHF